MATPSPTDVTLAPAGPPLDDTAPDAARLVAHLAVGVLACDAHGRGTHVSAPARALLGVGDALPAPLAFERALGALLTADGEPMSAERALVARALRGGSADDVEFVVVHGGARKVVSVAARPLVDADGVVDGAVLTLADVTRHRASGASDLLSRTGHELRTPLTAIRGALDLLLGDGSTVPPERRGLVDIVRRNVGSLMRVVNDLLDVERIEAGREPLELAMADAREIAALAADDVAPLAGQQGVALDVDVPAAGVWVDAARVRQVLATLASVAVARSPHGARVAVAARRDARWVRFEVRDAGPAIPPERIARAFERFEAPLPGARPRHVTGLALALSRAIVEQHGGHVELASDPAGGATFSFTVASFEGDEGHD